MTGSMGIFPAGTVGSPPRSQSVLFTNSKPAGEAKFRASPVLHRAPYNQMYMPGAFADNKRANLEKDIERSEKSAL
jgi:hypothetical protein